MEYCKKMKKLDFIFIGGKNLGYETLNYKFPKKINTKYKKKHFPNNGKIKWKWDKIYNFIRPMINESFPQPMKDLGSKSYFLVSKKYLNETRF